MRAFLAATALLLGTAAFAEEVDRGKVEVGGRLFVRGEAEKVEGRPGATRAELDSARLEGTYDWRFLRVVVEVELSDEAELKDAYLRFKQGALRGRVGRFKEPVSAIEMESAWVLPATTRGLLHELVVEEMAVAGRHVGAQVEWKGGGNLKPELAAGLFQAEDAEERPLPDHVTGAARFAMGYAGFTGGAFGEWRAAQPALGGKVDRFWVAGLDATFDRDFASGGLRLWADAFLGTSFVDFDPFDDDGALFAAGRIIAAYRFGGTIAGAGYVEPYVTASLVDPDLNVTSDVTGEVLLGVNVGAWKRARVQVEGQWQGQSRNTPPLLDASDRVAAVVQLGAAF